MLMGISGARFLLYDVGVVRPTNNTEVFAALYAGANTNFLVWNSWMSKSKFSFWRKKI